jgi:hypothetical protein
MKLASELYSVIGEGQVERQVTTVPWRRLKRRRRSENELPHLGEVTFTDEFLKINAFSLDCDIRNIHPLLP